MIPGTFSLNIYRGNTHAWRFQVWHDPAKTQPVDLAGVAVKAEIREHSGGIVIIPLTIAVTLPNVVDVKISATTCKKLPASARWDLQFTAPTGAVSTLLAGAVTVIDDITDSGLAPDRARRADHVRRAGYMVQEPLP